MTTSTQSLDRSRSGLRIFADLSLRLKLILVFLVVTLLAVGIIALLNIRGTSTALTTRVTEELKGLASSEASIIGSVLADRVEAMQAFTLDPEAQAAIAAQNAAYSGGTEAILAELTKLDEQWIAAGDDDPLLHARLEGELVHELENITVVVPDFAEVFLTDRYGGLVAASGRTSDYYQADEGWWQAAYNDGQGAVFIATPELDESTGIIGVDIAVPVFDQGNEVAGVLRTTLDATTLVKRLTNIELGETGEAGLFLGEEVFSAHQEREGRGYEAEMVAALAGETAPEGYVEASLEGQPNLIGYAAVSSPAGEQFISDLGWKVLVHQAQSEALDAVTAQTRNTLLLALLVAGITAVVAVAMGQVLASPIARLTGVVARFTEGDLSARVDIDSRDETGVLAASFNQMAEQVGTLLTDVQARSAELEERTRELEASQGVTFAASERTSPDELLGLVVDLVRDQFDLYHVQMYIVDEEQQAAVLRESTGYAGSQLLQSEHQISLDQTALVTKAIHEKEPVLVDDTSRDPYFMPNPLLPETQTELVVPLRVGDRVLGALDIQDRTPGRFSKSTIALFQAMTDQVAFLFENNELLERVTDQTESLTVFTTQLRTASDIAEQLSTTLDPEQMLHEMAELLQSRFGLYHAHIYVLETPPSVPPSGGEAGGPRLVVRAGSGEVGEVLREQGHSIPLDAEKSLVARAARSREPVLIEDTSLESDFMPNPLLPQTRSELAVPLVVGERVLGVLDIQDDQADRFAQTDVDTFTTLAGLAASSLQNAGLFSQVEASAQETQVRLEVSQSLAGAQTEEEVLDVLIQQAGLYPKTMVMIFTNDLDAEEETVVARRIEAFESGLESIVEPGMRMPVSQFQIKGEFVTPNIQLDERVDPVTLEMSKQMGTVSMALLPIMAGDQQLGTITLVSKEEGYYDEGNLPLYQTLAEQGAVALQAARLRDATQMSERQYRELLGSLRDGFAVVSMEGNIVDCNAAFEEISGYTLDELKEITFSDLTPEKWQATEAEILEKQVLARGYSDLYHKEYIKKDGSLVPVELAVYLVKDQEGNPAGFWGFIRDISVRKQAQEEAQNLATVVRYSSEMVNLTTPDGKMIFLNEAGSKMLGIEPDEVEQYAIPDVIPEGLLPKVQSQVLPAIMEQGTWEGELQYRNVKTDELTDVQAMTFTIKDPHTGAPLYLANVSLDITRRKRRETFLQEQSRVLAELAGSETLYSGDLKAALEEITEAAARVLDVKRSSVWLYDRKQTRIQCADVYEKEVGHSEGIELGGADYPAYFEALKEERIIAADDAHTDPRTSEFSESYLTPLGINSMLDAPIWLGGQMVGVVCNEHVGPGRQWTLEEQSFATSIADFVSSAMEAQQRRQTEKALRENEERFRGLYEASPLGIILNDYESGDYVEANQAFVDMIGYSIEELNQLSYWDLTPKKYEPDEGEQIRSMEQTGRYGPYQKEYIRKDGVHIPVVLNGVLVTDSRDRKLIWSTVADITYRVEAEEATRESQERLDLAIEAAEAGVWEFLPLAGETYFSDRWFTMLGYEPNELPHSYDTWSSLLHPDDLKVAEPMIQQKVQEGGDFITDFRMKAKNDGWRWIHAIGKTVETNEEGVATRMLGTHTDVTEDKLAEQERERFTTQLSTAAEIAGQVSAILDPDELLNTVIALLKERFNLYYAHFYRLDEAGGELVLSAGYGEPGRTMLEEGHSIPLDREQSLVAKAARSKESVVVQDVTQDPGFMPNPLLPHTKSEVAVPLISGDQVLGVFDVQHDETNYFTEGDLNVFSTLAGQVTTALQNASLFEALQESEA